MDGIDACDPVLALDYNVIMIAIQSFTVWLQNNTATQIGDRVQQCDTVDTGNESVYIY